MGRGRRSGDSGHPTLLIPVPLECRHGRSATACVRERKRDRPAAEHGRVFDVAGEQVAALPGAEVLLAVGSVPGLLGIEVDRLHAVARAAVEGLLDVHRLRAQEAAVTA